MAETYKQKFGELAQPYATERVKSSQIFIYLYTFAKMYVKNNSWHSIFISLMEMMAALIAVRAQSGDRD